MHDNIAWTTGGYDQRVSLAHSALPHAPVVPVKQTRTRRWTAARLQSVARATQQLAERVAA